MGAGEKWNLNVLEHLLVVKLQVHPIVDFICVGKCQVQQPVWHMHLLA